MKRFFAALGLLLALYFGVAATVFQWQNPTANRMQFWRHIGSGLTFEKLPQFQEGKK